MRSSEKQAKILVVDDEAAIRSGLTAVLQTAGYSVVAVESAEEALAYLEEHNVDLALLDIRMAGLSGMELMQQVRERWPDMAIILLTGYASLESAIAAVRAGADDYLTKPSRAETIKNSVAQALKRRLRERRRNEILKQLRESLNQLEEDDSQPDGTPTGVLRVADLTVDLLRHEAKRGTEILPLTPTEFDLLAYLMRNPEQVITHQKLVHEVQGYETEVWEARELTKYHIYALRQKLEPDPSNPQYIHTVRGIGYKLSPPKE